MPDRNLTALCSLARLASWTLTAENSPALRSVAGQANVQHCLRLLEEANILRFTESNDVMTLPGHASHTATRVLAVPPGLQRFPKASGISVRSRYVRIAASLSHNSSSLIQFVA